MKLGYIGLGKMGLNMVFRLLEQGVEVVANNRSPEPIQEAVQAGAGGAATIEELVQKLEPPRTIWLMVPFSVVDSVIEQLVPYLDEGDTIIDGGNSPYKESMRRAWELGEKGIDFLDCGVSGGPGGARTGACLMIGGRSESFEKYEALFEKIAAPDAYGYFGNAGAGHFVKMVHNGIEYGMMQAIAEGFAIMRCSDFGLDLEKVADVYNHESVITSKLMGWTKDAFAKFGSGLDEVPGSAAASGEGEWTIKAARELGIPTEVIDDALEARKASQEHPNYQGQMIQAIRNQFGGHPIKDTNIKG